MLMIIAPAVHRWIVAGELFSRRPALFLGPPLVACGVGQLNDMRDTMNEDD